MKTLVSPLTSVDVSRPPGWGPRDGLSLVRDALGYGAESKSVVRMLRGLSAELAPRKKTF